MTIIEPILNFFVENLSQITLLIFASLVGMEIIGRVPTLLHTPLMSGANAISGVTVIGGIYLVRTADLGDLLTTILGVVAVFLGTINVVGGFAVTNRMLEKFKKEKKDGDKK